MTDRLLFPVGGTGGGPCAQPFDDKLWHEILPHCAKAHRNINIALLTTPSKLAANSINIDTLLDNYRALGERLGCTFTPVDEADFGTGRYDGAFDILCITCGNTAGARNLWADLHCEQKIRSWYQKGTIITGYSAGFIVFFEWASTDSIPGPDGSKFGVMDGMGIIKGGAIPHADSQEQRIQDFQKILSQREISPVIALGEDVMAQYKNETLVGIHKRHPDGIAGWVTAHNFQAIKA